MIKAVVFDFDGTIVDSEKTRLESINYVLEKFNYQISRKDWKSKYKSFGTEPILDMIKKENNLPYDTQKLYKLSYSYRDSIEQKGIPLIKGFREFYDELEERNIRMLICSGGTSDHVKRVMKYSNLPKIPYFGRDQYSKRKPEPEPYLKALEILDLKKEDVLVFEDAKTGIESANMAGLRVIAVNYDSLEDFSKLDVIEFHKDYTEIDIESILDR